MIRVAPGRAVLVAAYMALIFTLTIVPGEQLSKLGIGRTLLDLGHIPLFAGFAAVTFWAINAPRVKRVVVAALFSVAFAAVGEWSQRFTPRRVPTFDDFGADCLGVAIGIAIALVASLVWMIPPFAQSRGGASR